MKQVFAVGLALCVVLSVLLPEAAWAEGNPRGGVNMAVTLDDLPFVGGVPTGDSRDAAAGRILAIIKKWELPTTGFVVCNRIGRGARKLVPWKDAGVQLASHTNSHPNADKTDPELWEEDVEVCHQRLQKITGDSKTWFRFPYLRRGKTERRRDEAVAFLKKLGHRIAPVSIDTGEYALVKPYVKALDKDDKKLAREIGQAWVDHIVTASRRYRDIGAKLTGDDIEHILLLHANVLAADYLDVLLQRLADEGWSFIPLDQAMKDPVYERKDLFAGPKGPSWLYRIQKDGHLQWAWDDAQVKEMMRRFGGGK